MTSELRDSPPRGLKGRELPLRAEALRFHPRAGSFTRLSSACLRRSRDDATLMELMGSSGYVVIPGSSSSLRCTDFDLQSLDLALAVFPGALLRFS